MGVRSIGSLALLVFDKRPLFHSSACSRNVRVCVCPIWSGNNIFSLLLRHAFETINKYDFPGTSIVGSHAPSHANPCTRGCNNLKLHVVSKDALINDLYNLDGQILRIVTKPLFVFCSALRNCERRYE